MKTFTKCIPCFFNQVLEVGRLTDSDDLTIKNIINKIALMIPALEYNQPPPYIAAKIHRIIKEELKINDYYKKQKEESNKLAQQISPQLSEKIKSSANSLLMAAKLAIAGNIIDFGAIADLDIQHEIDKILNEEEKHINIEKRLFFDFNTLVNKLDNAKSILYLGDNCGEIILDKLFHRRDQKI